MDAVTYPNSKVVEYLENNVVFFKPRIDHEPELARRFATAWTPGLLWLDAEGTPQHRNTGYFEPDEFLAEHLLGAGKVLGGSGDWEGALEQFEELVSQYPKSFAAPAGHYWAGVASKKATDDASGLV